MFALVATGALAAAVFIGLLWQERNSELTLPEPTGAFAVGRSLLTWSDDAHVDKLAPAPGMKRELAVWIWYPAATGQAARKADYFPAPWRIAMEQGRGRIINLLTRDLALVHAHSLGGVDPAPGPRGYPVIIIRGGHSALVAQYTILAEDLASHGYVVVGFDAPYRTAVVSLPGGRVIARTPENNAELGSGEARERVANKLVMAWSDDMSFVVDQLTRLNASDPSGRFTGRLDLQRLGVLGHSLGGAAALQFCRDDARCRAGIDLDGAPYGSVVREGVKQPFMILLSDHGNPPDARDGQVFAALRSIHDRLPENARFLLMIRGANHFGFSDDALLKSHYLRLLLQRLGIVGMDSSRQIAATAYYVHRFFDVCFKGAPRSSMQVSTQPYPEVRSVE